MEIYEANKIHLKGLFSIYNIQDEKANCVLNSYKNIHICVIEKPYELVELVDKQKDAKNTFYVYVFKNEPIYKYMQQFFDNETPSSHIATDTFYRALMRSYYFYLVYFNKGIRSYVLKHDEFLKSIVYSLLSLILVCAKRSYIAIDKQALREIKMIVSIFVLYCLLGVQSKSQIMSILNKLEFDMFDKVKILVFYNYFAEKLEQNKSLVHIIGELQKWNKLACNTMIIQITRYLGSTLTDILLTCNLKDIGDPLVTTAYKLSLLYFYYNSGQIHKEVNLPALNRITDFAFGKMFKVIQLPIKKAHFGKC